MPHDTSYGPAAFAPAARGGQQLRPVESVASVWATALREYRIEKVEQLPLRARMLNVLEHLQRGHLLAMLGTALPVVWLDGHQDIAVLAGVLFCYGYVEVVGRHRDNANIVYFGLSPAGARKLQEGRAWWNTLSLRQRLLVRLFG